MHACVGTELVKWEQCAGGKVLQLRLEAASPPLQQTPSLEGSCSPGRYQLCLLARFYHADSSSGTLPCPPQGSRTRGSVCRSTHVCEPAATGWTVFVNPLETSQYSPALHLLHALKLTVQATRMTLTDLTQYNVF